MKKAAKSYQAVTGQPTTKGGSTKPFFQKKGKPASDLKSDAFFQAKLKINAPNDKFEREADHIADQVTSEKPPGNKGVFQQISPFVQRQTETEGENVQAKEETTEQEEVQRKPEAEEKSLQKKIATKTGEKEEVIQEKSEGEERQEESVQMKEGEEESPIQLKEQEESLQMKEDEESFQRRSAKAIKRQPSNDFSNKLQSKKGQGSPIPEEIKNKLESTFAADFSGIRIHTDATAADLSQEINAQAFTTGKDVFFNQGKFKPGTKEGLHLLAHELTHTIQQGVVSPKIADPSNLTTVAPNTFSSPIPNSTKAIPQERGVNEKIEFTAEAEMESLSEELLVDEILLPQDAAIVVEELDIYPGSPEEDPNFQALTERIDETAKSQKKHQPADSLSQNASDAAPSPANERTSLAQVGQVNEMDRKEPQTFNAASFKKMLLDKIIEILPENEEQADNFGENNEMDHVKSAASNKVTEEKQAASGGIPEATAKEPNTSSIPERQTLDLKTPQAGKQPANLRASKAMPPQRPSSQVNQPLQENAKEVDNKMAENNVTDEQLARSEEPTFIVGMESKKTAQDHSKTAPDGFRQQETNVLDNAQQQTDATSQEQLGEMHGGRAALFNQAAKKQNETKTGNTSKREAVAKEIDTIYEKTKTDVNTVLTDLDGWVATKFEVATTEAKELFERYIDWAMDKYKEERYGAWFDPRGWGSRLNDAFQGLPDEVNQFFVIGRKLYIDKMEVYLTQIANHVATELNRAQEIIAKGRENVQKFVNKQPADLKKFAQEKANEIQDSFNQLNEDVSSKQEELVDTIAENYKASLEEVEARIDEMKAANRGLIDKAMDAINGIVETINKLRQVIADLMSAIQSVVPIIMNDPIGFMGKLFEGIGNGFENFKNNIRKHLLGGLFKWLTGAMGPIGIEVPEDIFSIKGIFNLIIQVLGLGWAFIRRKLVFAVGEKAVSFLEKGYEVIKIINEKGIDGIWEFVKSKFQDLKATVLDAIQDMIITQVIQAGVKWLLGLLIPGAGFIKAIMAIKDVIVFFVESAIALIPAITEAILALASGAKDRVAKAIEFGLGTLVPIVIGLFARLIGLTGLTKKVQKIIKKIRKRISDQVNKMIRAAKDWLKKMFRKGKAGVKKVGAGAKKVKDKIVRWWKIKVEFKGGDGKSHKLFFKGKGKNAKLTIASQEQPYVKFLNAIEVDENDSTKKKALTEAKKVAKEIEEKKNKPLGSGTEEAKKRIRSKKEKDLRKLLVKLKKHTKHLFGSNIPKWEPPEFMGTTSAGYGKGMKAKLLTINGLKKGSPPRVTSNAYNILNTRRTKGGASYYVRGHLLNESLGGEGNNWENLTPLSRSGNAQHAKRFEALVKASINSGAIMEYFVTPVYKVKPDKKKMFEEVDAMHSHENAKLVKAIIKAEDFIPKSLKCKTNRLEKTGNNEFKKVPPSQNWNIPNPLSRKVEDYHIISSKFVGPVNINSGNILEYKKLPRVGNIVAKSIEIYLDSREEPFESLTDVKAELRTINGLTESVVQNWIDHGKIII